MFRSAPTCFLIAHGLAENIRETVRATCEENSVELITLETASMRSASTGDVADAIERADFVIADVSDGGRNTFFELGIAHGMRKRILTISERTPDMPSDIGGLKILYYRRDDPRLIDHISEWIQESVALTA